MEAAPAPARRGRPRSAATEQKILETAYRLMAQEGLTATTIDAVARHSGVSKMTIYKWWPSREPLLVDAFLRQASSMLPVPETGDGLTRIRTHAVAYAHALLTDFGRVQLAVIAECVGNTGSAQVFSDRYIALRRARLMQAMAAGQQDGSILCPDSPTELHERIYGAMFYRYVFGFGAITPENTAALVDAVLLGRQQG